MNPQKMQDITGRAVQDAIMYGMGVIVISNDARDGLAFRYVPREEYEQLVEALQWQKDDNKGAMQ